jgi:uncharacterized protein (UPF0335 family)
MNKYELKQGILDKMEIEGLIERIAKLEKENAELKNQLKPFIAEADRRNKFIEKRDEIDGKIAQMMYNFNNQNKQNK